MCLEERGERRRKKEKYKAKTIADIFVQIQA